MNLYIMRHGKAAERGRGGEDSERPLTAEGKRKTTRSAEGLLSLGLRLDAVWSSPYLRARETARIVAEVLGLGKGFELTERLQPGADLAGLVRDLAARKGHAENVLLVGHEPMLSELVSLLVSGKTASVVVLKKGALCKLVADELELGRCARLEWLLTAKQMSAMRRRK